MTTARKIYPPLLAGQDEPGRIRHVSVERV